MSTLNDFISVELAMKALSLSTEELAAIVQATSVGFQPANLPTALKTISDGGVVALPSTLGQARPLTIHAKSFVNDPGQYRDTYGLTVAQAADLREKLETEPDEAVDDIRKIVTAALQKRGSNKPVRITRHGDGTNAADTSFLPPDDAYNKQLKVEIRANSAIYGMYKFDAVDTGRGDDLRYKVKLGAGLYAVFKNKAGAVDIARITRVKGRDHPIVSSKIAFWRDGKAPLFGADIPEAVTFDGKLSPNDALPPDPVSKAQTELPLRGSGQAPPFPSQKSAAQPPPVSSGPTK